MDSKVNVNAPKPTTQFERMDYFPLYPVFSWIPVDGSGGYEIRVSRENKFSPGRYEVVRVMTTKNNVSGFLYRMTYNHLR